MNENKFTPGAEEALRLSQEAAGELGLLEKLQQVGWAGLSTAESGRIGGCVGAKKRKMRKE